MACEVLWPKCVLMERRFEGELKMRDRGTGSIYRRPASRFYQIKFSRDGRVYRESTGTDRVTEAKAILQDRLSKLNQGMYSSDAKKVRVSELVDSVMSDYRVNGKKSVESVKTRWKLHLQPAFGHMLEHTSPATT